MSARILDGKALAKVVREEVKRDIDAIVSKGARRPGLHVVRVGEDPASVVYTRNKEKASNEVGMIGKLHELDVETSEADLLALVDRLNDDDTVDGILVQLPLPEQIDSLKVLDSVAADKDVDGFHPINAGLLASGRPGLVPCTPLGCMRLLALAQDKPEFDGSGLSAVVIGRSNIVGKPMAQLLLGKNATVTIAHSRTKDLAAVCRQADVVVAAVGKPQMVRGDWIKPGAIVVDVGINRVPREDGKSKLVGDVAFDEAAAVASAITPVPGGVGPLTIAHLLVNTLRAYERRTASA